MLVYLLDELYGVLMGHAQIAQFAQQLPQILLQIFPAGGVCVRRAADEAALSGYGINVSLLLQLVVGPLDGVGIDGQLGGQGSFSSCAMALVTIIRRRPSLICS